MSDTVTLTFYLVAAVLFILGLKFLTSPKTAMRGNILSAVGMLTAIIVTLLSQEIIGYIEIIVSLIIGASLGSFFALKIKMTAMPQMVAILNGFGGVTSAIVASIIVINMMFAQSDLSSGALFAAFISILIGGVTFSGSLLAFIKLQFHRLSGEKILPGRNYITIFLLVVFIVSVLAVFLLGQMYWWLLCSIIISSLLLGLSLVLPIGGANMPVVIALLNAYSGLAACATGFVIDNLILIVAGSLVGASGFILTKIMCHAMNRPFYKIIFATVEAKESKKGSEDAVYEGRITSTSADEVAMIFDSADNIIIVPGYGMAVAQAQHAVSELSGLLKKSGKNVRFAIHPVAGRMPGHMNVLLAEADVPYEDLFSMEDINFEFSQADAALIIGANDVTNPLARDEQGSPISGMPILNVDQAQSIIVIKRSLSPGFAGIANPLFANDKTLMLFDDAKQATLELVRALREIG